MFKRFFLAAVTVAIGLASQSFAQSIFTNAITDLNPSASNPYATGQVVDAGITATGIGRGPTTAAESAANRYAARGWNAAAFDTNKYFTFTLTPNAGNAINLTNFIYTGQASGTGPSFFAFRSSLDTFTNNIGTPLAGGATIDLSGAPFQNLTSASEFRLYGWNASSTAGTFSVNDFTFNGTITAVPEPTSLALLGIAGCAGLVAAYRRRKSKKIATV